MENELSRVVAAMPGFVWTAHPDGQIDFLNQRWCEYTGLEPDQTRDGGWRTAIHPEDLPALVAGWRNTAAPGASVESDARVLGADGNYRWFLFRGQASADDHGQMRWCGLSTDIDLRKQSEQATCARERRYRQIFDGLPVLLSTAAPDGELEQANAHYLEYFGAPLDELKARETVHGLHPDDRSRVLQERQQAIDAGEPYEIECRRRRADGVYRWFQLRAFPLRDQAGQIVQWCRLQIDIGEQKRAETLLAGEKQLLEMVASGDPMPQVLEALCRLVETATDKSYCSIVLLDPDGTKLQEAIAPSLPAEFNESVRDWPLDRRGGPCVTAARDNVQVIMPDVALDTRWRNSWRTLAQKHGLRSCWSTPILSLAGKVLGTFALYRGEAGSPSLPQLELIRQFTHVASIAIERAQRDGALQQSEARLAAAERDLRATIDTIPVFVAAYQPDGVRSFVNKTWQDYMGLSLDEATGSGAKAFPHFHTDDAERNEHAWRASLASGEPLSLEVRVRRADGQYRWHSSNRVPMRDEEGNVVKWYSVGIDIEDQKRGEIALRESEAQLADAKRELQLTVDSIPAMAHVLGPDGAVEFVNQTYRDYSGLGTREATAEVRKDFHPDDAERVSAAWRASLATGEPFQADLRLRRRDGTYRWHTLRRVPRRDENGAIVKWYGVASDIDERKRAEDARRRSDVELAEAKQELQSTIDSIPALVASYWPNGQRDFVNLAWQRFNGISQEEARGKTQMITVHPDTRSIGARMWEKCLETGEPFELDEQLRRADGVYRWHWVRRVPVRDESGKVIKWYGIGHDIEELRQVEHALRLSEARLAETEHELRVTLDSIPTITWRGGVNGYVQSLNKRWFEYTGTTSEQMRGGRWKQCVHPDDIDRLVDVGVAYVASGEATDCEARLRRFDGEYRWFLFRPAPARDEMGNIVGWYGTISDIEDRKRAEEKVLEAERELQRTVDTIPAMVGTYTAAGLRESVNKWACEYTGLSVENWTNAFHPDDIGPIEAQWRECLAKGEPLEREHRVRAADGTYRWVLTRRVPLRDETGRVVRWYGIAHDIEDRKRAEDAVAESERSLKLIIDTIPALAWASRNDGSAEFVNKHYQDFVGVSHEQLEGMGWTAAVHPDDLRGLTLGWRKMLAAGEGGEMEARMRRHDGQYRRLMLRTNPLRDEAGRIVKWYGINTDIEDRKRAEEELRRSETLLAEGQRLSLTGTFSWLVGTNRIAFSQELRRIFEFEPDTFLTLGRLRERTHPEDRALMDSKVNSVREGQDTPEYEIRLQMPDGRIKHARIMGHVVRHLDGRLECLGAIQDVTQGRNAEAALDKTRSELAHVTRVMSLGALTASIAHEVNQPLAGIITNASTCLRMLAAEPPNVEGARETARRTIRDGNRAADVISRLRALFARKAATSETVDLNEAAREVISLVFSDLLRNRVIVRVELEDHRPLRIVGDRVQLQQVILNLVRNASDALSGVDDRPRHLLIRADEDDDGQVRLIVKDSGPGIEAPDAERLFDAFYSTKDDGMGIGLSVSRSIIESHGGRLWAERNEGPGATFSFSIPRQATSAGDESAIWTHPTKGAHDQTRNA